MVGRSKMYKVAGWFVLYFNHRRCVDVMEERDFHELKRLKGWTYIADGTYEDMEALAKLANGIGTNFFNHGGLTNVS